MTVQKIIEEMENAVLDLVVDCRLKPMEPKRPMIRKTLRTLLEAFGEEIIGEMEKEERMLKQGIDYDVHKILDFGMDIARVSGKNELRAEQRLKVKEIINSITK